MSPSFVHDLSFACVCVEREREIQSWSASCFERLLLKNNRLVHYSCDKSSSGGQYSCSLFWRIRFQISARRQAVIDGFPSFPQSLQANVQRVGSPQITQSSFLPQYFQLFFSVLITSSGAMSCDMLTAS